MSLNMYIGGVQAQTESMNAFCDATIQGMEEVIRSIDAFALDVTLKGKTYESAKTFFMQTYRQLAQGIIYLCEELIIQNNAFPADFQAEVATVDVVEQEIREQIRELEQMIAAIAAMDEQTPGAAAILQIYHAMKRKLEDKLERLYQFNSSSSENYRTAIELASSIAKGLAEVQSGKGFQAVSGTFHTERINMEWARPIQLITEEKARKADNKMGENKEFTEEEVQAIQQYLEGIKDGTIKGNMDKDFHVETDAYEMEHNIFGLPVGGGKPTLDPYLVNMAQFGFDFFISDLLTLFDSEATVDEKIVAMGLMTPKGKFVKIADKLKGVKKSGDTKTGASGSGDGNKGTSKDIKNYRKTFFDEYPELEGSVVVHHAIEQQVLKKYPNLFTLEEIHALENLRGIPKEINSDIHLSKIRKDWNRFYRNHPNPTKEEIINYMIELDKKYGEDFNPPVKR